MRKMFLFLFLILSNLTFVQGNQGTVVGIHGFLVPSHSLVQIRKVLRRACFDVYLWEYSSREMSTRCHANRLIETLKWIAYLKPGEPIHFVAHSVGSWVLRATLNHPECPEEAKIGRAVLLAPANQGSKLARRFKDDFLIRLVMGDKTGYELMTYEPADVQCLGMFPPSMQVLVLAGYQGTHPWFTKPNDGWLEMEETWMETPYCYYALPLTHGKLLTNSRSLQMIRDFLLCGSL